MFKAITESLVSFVFPLSCEICGKILPARGGAVCLSCKRSIPVLGEAWGEIPDAHFDRVFAACRYEGAVRSLVHAFKFKRKRLLASDLAGLLEKRLKTVENRWDILAAVPMPSAQRFERGFNQAELLARGVSRSLSVPFSKKLLDVTGPLSQQAKLDRTRRKQNVRGRFRAGAGAAGKNVLLVDDVLTTGSTASECARALKKAGALSVDVLVVARGAK